MRNAVMSIFIVLLVCIEHVVIGLNRTQKRPLVLSAICGVFRSISGALKKEVYPQTGHPVSIKRHDFYEKNELYYQSTLDSLHLKGSKYSILPFARFTTTIICFPTTLAAANSSSCWLFKPSA